MSQTSYANESAASFAGLKADSRFDTVESFIALYAMDYGRAAGGEVGNVTEVHTPVLDVGTLLFDADFVTGNSITITVNGVAGAAVPFDTDHATTSAAVLASIQAIAGVTSASISDPGTDREFTIETEGVAITVAEAITGGASQATGSVDYTTDKNDIFRGITLHQHNEAGVYAAKAAVNVLRQGVVWVETSKAVTADSDAYVDLAGGIGKFTDTSTNNLATGGKFRSTVAAAGLAKLEINLP